MTTSLLSTRNSIIHCKTIKRGGKMAILGIAVFVLALYYLILHLHPISINLLEILFYNGLFLNEF